MAVALVAATVAVLALAVAATPWLHYGDADLRYAAIFTLFSVALGVLAVGLLQWEWLWESARATLLVAGVWALLGEAVGLPLGHGQSWQKTAMGIAALVVTFLLGMVPVHEYFARQAQRRAEGRDLHP